MEDPSKSSTLPLNQDSSMNQNDDQPPSVEQPGYHAYQTPNTLNQSNTYHQDAASVMPYPQPQIPYSSPSDLSSQTRAYPTTEQPPVNAPPYAAPPYDTLYPASLPYPVQQTGNPAYMPPIVDPSEPPPPYPGPPNAVHYEAHLLSMNQAGPHGVTTTTTVHPHQLPKPPGADNQPPGQPPANVTIVRTVQDNGREIESHMVLSFFSVFCCFCFGLIALVRSASVSSLVSQGRYAEAQRASNQAKFWSTVAIVFGLLITASNIIRLMLSDSTLSYH